jgi:hypothetical protein
LSRTGTGIQVAANRAADDGANLEFEPREGQELADFVEKLPDTASSIYY